MIILISIVLAYFSIISLMCLYLKYEHEHKTKITHNPYYGFWFNFTIMSLIPLLSLFMVRNHFNKPSPRFNRTLITLDDLNECIRLFMYENTIFWLEDQFPGNIIITVQNQNIFAFGFMRRVAKLKAEVARNLPVGLKVHWSVFK